jgi:transcriptional regulator with PAS, ATPase and Fis domain
MANKSTASTADTVQQDDGHTVVPVAYALTLLYCPDPDRDGHVMRLAQSEAPVKIGRKVKNEGDLGLADPAVSKIHAEITWSPVRQGYLLGDLRSRNGTRLNGHKIERELLGPGDIIRIGDTVMSFGSYDADSAEWSSPEGSLLVGRSPSLQRVLDRIAKAAASDVSVLVLGETGTGKELVTSTLHEQSERKGPLCALNCAAIPLDLVESELFGHTKGAFSGADVAKEGMFRAADGGTLFLDEVGELSQDVQAKLLRALETKRIRPVGSTSEIKVDVRVVSATNRNLETAVQAGIFRADLYARIAEWVIKIEPLRHRLPDLWPLWQHFTELHGNEIDLIPKGAVFEAMALYDWPYNVREISGLVRNLVLSKPEGGKVSLEDLPDSLRGSIDEPSGSAELTPVSDLPPPGETPTPRELRRLVEEFAGNVKEVAAFLGKDRTQVYRWLKRYDIDPSAYRK